MNEKRAKESWEAQKCKLKERYSILTDNDLLGEESLREEMYGRIQEKLGKTKEELHKIIQAI